MKKLLCCLSLIMCAAIFAASCGIANKHFMEITGAFSFDAESGTLIKYPSLFMFEPNEILIYNPANSRTQAAEYSVTRVTVQRHDSIMGTFDSSLIEIAHTVQNGRLVIASVPLQMPLFNYFRLGDSTDSLIITAGDENAYLVDLSNATARRLFDERAFGDYFRRDSIKQLVFARVVSVSPDGRFILYISNRNFMDDMALNSFDLFYFDMQTGRENFIMNFYGKEVISWDRDSPSSFLFRELIISPDGARTFSPIYSYSLEAGRRDIFLNINERYRGYEIIDDEHIYILRNDQIIVETPDGDQEILEISTLYVANIYTREMFAVDPGRYTSVMNVKVSDTGEYIAFWGFFVNRQGIALTELVTIHVESNDIVAQYEQNVDNYTIDSFYWLPGNILGVNFINRTNPDRHAFRLHRIAHSSRVAPPRDAMLGAPPLA